MKIAIVGAAYTGRAAALYFRNKGYSVSVSTTRQERTTDLAEVANHIVVMKGSDSAAMESLIRDADVVLLSMAGGLGVRMANPLWIQSLPRPYVGTAEGPSRTLCRTETAPNHLLQFHECLWRYGIHPSTHAGSGLPAARYSSRPSRGWRSKRQPLFPTFALVRSTARRNIAMSEAYRRQADSVRRPVRCDAGSPMMWCEPSLCGRPPAVRALQPVQ
jgi:hypothetical protein